MHEFCVLQSSGPMSASETRRSMMDFLDAVMSDIHSHSEGGQYSHVITVSKPLMWLHMVNAQGRVVLKPVNANPGLKVNQGNNFSGIKVLSIAYALCSLRLLVLKTEGQKT